MGRVQGRLAEIGDMQSNLVERMSVMSQETFKRQMERLEKEEGDLKALLSDSVHQLPNVSNALKLAWNYLHTPSLVWASAGIQTKLKLQRFQFPHGVMFDGQKFETTEVSCIFGLKSEKSTALSTVVWTVAELHRRPLECESSVLLTELTAPFVILISSLYFYPPNITHLACLA